MLPRENEKSVLRAKTYPEEALLYKMKIHLKEANLS